jgi:hypothetical protein
MQLIQAHLEGSNPAQKRLKLLLLPLLLLLARRLAVSCNGCSTSHAREVAESSNGNPTIKPKLV